MKCRACGYEGALFERFYVPAGSMFEDKNGDEHFNQVGHEKIFVCPECGTLQVETETKRSKEKEEREKFFEGCICPWCGNFHPEEFAIRSECGAITSPHGGDWFRVECSCGASGPIAEDEIQAIDKFKKWRKR